MTTMMKGRILLRFFKRQTLPLVQRHWRTAANNKSSSTAEADIGQHDWDAMEPD